MPTTARNTLPTIGPAAEAAVTTIEIVCMPVLRRASLAKTAESAGFRQKGGEWRLDLPRHARIDLQPPDAANPNLCGQTILSPAGAGAGLRLALANWARAHGLKPVQFDVASKGFQYERTTSTWSGQVDARPEGVALSQEKTFAGKPVDGSLDQSVLLVKSRRPGAGSFDEWIMRKTFRPFGSPLVVAAGFWCCAGGVLADQVSAANVRAHRQYELRLAAYQKACAQAVAETAAYHKALAAWRLSTTAWQARMAAMNAPTNVVD